MKKERKDGRFSQFLKWVGYLTAIFSLGATIAGVAKYIYSRVETRKDLAALFATEVEQQKSGDYSSAWQTLEKAAQLLPGSPKVRETQKKLAMAWLENIHLQENQKFSDVAQKVEPILTRAVAAAKPGREQADLLAHVGWPTSSNRVMDDSTSTPSALTAKPLPKIPTILTPRLCGATGSSGTIATGLRKPRLISPPRWLRSAKATSCGTCNYLRS